MIPLARIIQNLDQIILSSSGVDSFEEIIKILFIKMYDEIENDNKFFRASTFNNPDQLLTKADKKYPGIIASLSFESSTTVLKKCFELLSDTSIFTFDASAFDNAIEYLLPHTHRGTRGQFMTPRHIVAGIIQMMHPLPSETIIDPACGSGGFLEYSVLSQKKSKREKYAKTKVYGADYDTRMTQIARLVLLKSSGSDANITASNSLTDKLFEKKFDIVLCNPPYGGKITDESILGNYYLANKNPKKSISSISRHILFIEKCIDLAKEGGRIALILPQGVLNNSGMRKVHRYIFDSCRLVGVISLPESTFMPHTNVKTSIVILQKWKDKAPIDYEVFMEISKKSGKDSKGKIIFVGDSIDHDISKISKDFKEFKKVQKINW